MATYSSRRSGLGGGTSRLGGVEIALAGAAAEGGSEPADGAITRGALGDDGSMTLAVGGAALGAPTVAAPLAGVGGGRITRSSLLAWAARTSSSISSRSVGMRCRGGDAPGGRAPLGSGGVRPRSGVRPWSGGEGAGGTGGTEGARPASPRTDTETLGASGPSPSMSWGRAGARGTTAATSSGSLPASGGGVRGRAGGRSGLEMTFLRGGGVLPSAEAAGGGYFESFSRGLGGGPDRCCCACPRCSSSSG